MIINNFIEKDYSVKFYEYYLFAVLNDSEH